MKCVFATMTGAIACAAVALCVPELSAAQGHEHAVFVMSNNADANQVVSFSRAADGTLGEPRYFPTGGRGSGGTVDPLASQGSLSLSDDRTLLLATNAGSGTVSAFFVDGRDLRLTDVKPTEGSEPNAVVQHGSLVYVLNTAGSSSVVGFTLQSGRLSRIPNSLRFLSGNGVGSASLAFSPDGRYLLVTERSTNRIDVFSVLSDGTLSSITENEGAGAGLLCGGVCSEWSGDCLGNWLRRPAERSDFLLFRAGEWHVVGG